jgi:diacylglycerol kinase (ATP)
LSTLKHIHFITNPMGGVGDNLALARDALAFFGKHGIQGSIHPTQHPGQAIDLAATLPLDPASLICAIGGDGTMHEVINGVMRRSAPSDSNVALLPGGTGNSVMEDLGLLKLQAAMQAILEGSPKKIDLIRTELDGSVQYAFNLCGWGMMARGNERAEAMRWLGRGRYHVAGLLEIMEARSLQAGLEIEGQPKAEDHYALVVATNSRIIGKGMRVAPNARMDDGKMDLLLVKKAGRWDLAQLFARLHRGTHIHHPLMHYIQVNELKLESHQPVAWNVDGEVRRATKAALKVLPGRLNWWLPDDGD